MVNAALMDQLERLSPSELVELRDVIEAKLGDDVPAGQWAILEQRVAPREVHRPTPRQRPARPRRYRGVLRRARSHETERCLDAIETVLNRIERHAHQPPVSRFGLRHLSTDTFRYHVWYRLFEEERFVQVVAVLHHRRGDSALAGRVL